MKSWRSLNHLAPCILAISLLWSTPAIATENFAGFRHIDATGEPSAAPDWGPVETDKASVANLSPVLLPFFNNGPVFGLPGTVVGDFWQNTQLTGDWGGFRTSLAEHGIFVDLYSTSAYQDVASGGLKTGSSFVENILTSTRDAQGSGRAVFSTLPWDPDLGTRREILLRSVPPYRRTPDSHFPVLSSTAI